jgi:hypothetical protein
VVALLGQREGRVGGGEPGPADGVSHDRFPSAAGSLPRSDPRCRPAAAIGIHGVQPMCQPADRGLIGSGCPAHRLSHRSCSKLAKVRR